MRIVFDTQVSPVDMRAIYNDIEALWAIHKLNRNEQAVVAIGVMIARGIDLRRRICGAMKRLGFKPSHAAVILNKSAGNDPERHHWKRNSQGVYSLLEVA